MEKDKIFDADKAPKWINQSLLLFGQVTYLELQTGQRLDRAQNAVAAHAESARPGPWHHVR